MKTIRHYLFENRMRLLTALALCAVAVLFGMHDPAMAGATLMGGMALDTAGATPDALIKALGAHSDALKGFIERSEEREKEFQARLLDLEQKRAHRPGGGSGGERSEFALADAIIKSDGLSSYLGGKSNAISVQVPRHLFKTAIVNAQGQNQPLVQSDRQAGIIAAPQRRLTIRDLFVSIPTTSNLVEYAKESAYTNNAGLQFNSPNDVENVIKNESGMTFTLANVAVATIAHWMPASRQVLSDAPALQQHLDDRLLYGLKLVEETEILLGDGTAGHLSGLLLNSTSYNRGVSNDTTIDTLAKGILQAILSEYTPNGIILNPADWFQIQMIKDTQGRYVFGAPQESAMPMIWGIPVVATNSMTQGKFMVLDSRRAGYIADREDATVKISDSHSDFFVRNMVAILCEERMAFVSAQSGAVIYGTLPPVGT